MLKRYYVVVAVNGFFWRRLYAKAEQTKNRPFDDSAGFGAEASKGEEAWPTSKTRLRRRGSLAARLRARHLGRAL